jgi:trk system potassium uptake protein TrkA
VKIIVIGCGRMGAGLAQALSLQGAVTAVDADPAAFDRLGPSYKGKTIPGSAVDRETLLAAGIRHANVVAAVTGADETNLVVTSLARFEFHVPRTIARVKNPRNAWMFTPDLGVDIALNQADLLGHIIVEEMSLGDMTTLLKLRKGLFSLVEEKVHPEAAASGRAVRDPKLPEACILVAVLRKGEMLHPAADLTLQPADEVLAVVHATQAGKLAALLGPRRG